LLAVGLALAVTAVYWPARDHAWLNYDDDVYITDSPGILLGFSGEGMEWAFTSFQGANWFPLTRLSWMLDYRLAGLDAAQFHTTSLLLHALATALLFLALARLTGSPGRSAFAAGIFGLHPLQVEAVAWAAGRKDPLSAVWFAAALLCYSAPRGRARTAAVFVCLAFGLMAKQTLVTLPFVLLLLDGWPGGRLRPGTPGFPKALRDALVEKLPLFALVGAAAAMTLLAQGSAGVVADADRLPVLARFANASLAIATYLRQALFPIDLGVFYPHPGAAYSGAAALAAAGMLVVLTGIALRVARACPAVLVGWLWFLGMLVPVLGLIQVGDQSGADRYMYLPLAGLGIAAAWGVPAAVERLRPGSERILAVLAVLCLVTCSAVTTRQLSHWRNSESLMRHTLAVTGENYIAHAYLGAALLEGGDVAGTVEQWRAAARIAPAYPTVANNLAWLLATHPAAVPNSADEAVVLAQRAARLTGNSPAALDTLAAAYARAGRREAAVRTATEARDAARAAGNEALADAIARRLVRYRAGDSWREE